MRQSKTKDGKNSIYQRKRGIGAAYSSLDILNNLIGEEELDYLEFDFSLDGLVAFDGDGHYYNCLDYRKNRDNPQISYIDIECNEEQIIAENFDEFLTMLTLDTEAMWAVKSEKTAARNCHFV